MKKSKLIVLVIVALLVASTLPAQAADHFRGGHSRVGDFRGDHFRGGDFRGGHSRFFGGDIWGDPWWGPGWGPWWWGYGAYPYYYGYWPPTVINQEESPAYVEPAPQTEEQTYWYYCPESRNYYPYVKKCPDGWLKVVPTPAPSDYKE